MGPGQQLHRLSCRTVAGDLSMVVVVQAHDLSQHMSVTRIGLRTEVECRSRYRADDIGLIA
jgi:hypothetical protein